MPHDSNSSDQNALLLSDDPMAVSSIREFLVTHGCTMISSSDELRQSSYLVVYGMYTFVKSSLARIGHPKSKILLLLVEGSKSEVASFSNIPHVRVVVVSSHALGSESVKKIFHFFFTGTLPVFWMIPPREDETVRRLEKTNIPSEGAGNSSDLLRIKKTMEELFRPVLANPAKKRKFKRHTRVLLFLVLLFLPYVWFILAFSGSVLGVFASASLLKQGEIERAREVSTFTSRSISSSDTALTIVLAPLYVLGLESQVVFPERIVSLLRSVNDGLNEAYTASDLGKQFFSAVTTPVGGTNATEDKAPLATMLKLKNELLSLYGTLGRIEADLSRLTGCRCGVFYFPFATRIGDSLTERISTLRSRISEASSLLSLYPQIGGFREKKVYLFLFQNSMELRPTGGFIGSIALATFADGRLSDFTVEDVYTADGQLKGHVDPPKPISLHLGQEHWYLRDSNWNPSFPVSAEKAAWFYEKEMGVRVHGVVGISLPLVQDLLGLVGPIDLPDGDDRITRDNFFVKSLYYTEDSFFPGSTKKKDFLGSLSRSLIEKLLHTRSVPATSMLSLFGKSLRTKNILLYFRDPILSRFIDTMGWAGSAPRGDACSFIVSTDETPCISDGIMVSEANVGVNKVNFATKREMVHDISISEQGSISEVLTYVLKNTASAADSRGGGTYSSYLQIFLPKDTENLAVSLDGVPLPVRSVKETAKPGGAYYEFIDSNSSSALGAWVMIPSQGVKRLTVSYTRSERILPHGSVYGFLVTKQPGVDDMDTEIRLTYPLFFHVKPVHGTRLPTLPGMSVFLAKNSQLVYNTVLAQDTVIAVSFSQ